VRRRSNSGSSSSGSWREHDNSPAAGHHHRNWQTFGLEEVDDAGASSQGLETFSSWSVPPPDRQCWRKAAQLSPMAVPVATKGSQQHANFPSSSFVPALRQGLTDIEGFLCIPGRQLSTGFHQAAEMLGSDPRPSSCDGLSKQGMCDLRMTEKHHRDVRQEGQQQQLVWLLWRRVLKQMRVAKGAAMAAPALWRCAADTRSSEPAVTWPAILLSMAELLPVWKHRWISGTGAAAWSTINMAQGATPTECAVPCTAVRVPVQSVVNAAAAALPIAASTPTPAPAKAAAAAKKN